MFYLFLKR